jgi:hypothetical protein
VCVCVLIYKDIRKLVSLRPCIHVPQATASGCSWTRVRHVAHPQWWASILYHHACILSRDGHCVTLVRYPIEFDASGEGPRGHEILHHAAVPKIVLDGVSVVWESLLKVLLEVFYGRLRLVLAAAYGSHDAHHTGAARLPTIATIIINRSCGLSMTLLVSFHATRGTLPGILNGDVG